MDNINAIQEAMDYEGDWFYPPGGGEPKFIKYEPDFLHDNSENFGPFIVDYSGHNIKLPDWNLVVSSSAHTKGKGNVGVGIDNFYYDASNSFIAGKHNIV